MITLSSHPTICDPFRPIKTGDNIGIKTIRYISRVTGEQAYIRLDPYSELLASTVDSSRGAVFLNKLVNAGFQVSPLKLAEFLHVVLFPADAVTIEGPLKYCELPEGATIVTISSLSEVAQ